MRQQLTAKRRKAAEIRPKLAQKLTRRLENARNPRNHWDLAGGGADGWIQRFRVDSLKRNHTLLDIRACGQIEYSLENSLSGLEIVFPPGPNIARKLP